MGEAPTNRNAGGLFRKLTGMLARPDTPTRAATPQTPPPPAVTENPVPDGAGLGGYIELDLEPVIARYGDEWKSVARGAYRMIEGIIANRLGRNDCYMRHGSDKYFILFRGLSEVEARLKSHLLAEEIIGALAEPQPTGPSGTQSVSPVTARISVAPAVDDSPLETCRQFIEPPRQHRSEAVETGAADGAAPISPAQHRRLTTLLEVLDHELRQPQAPRGAKQTAARTDRLESMIHVLRQANEILAGRPGQPVSEGAKCPFGTLKEALATGLQQAEAAFFKAAGRPAYTPPPPRDGRLSGLPAPYAARAPGTAPAWVEAPPTGQLPGWESGGAVPAPVKAPPPIWKADEATLDQAEVSFLYRPLWQVKANALNAYFCAMMVDDGTAPRPYHALFADLAETAGQAPIHTLADQLTLRKGLGDIAALISLGKKCRVVVPVHFSTLNSAKARHAYVEMLRTVSDEQRKLLVIEIIYPFSAISNLPIFEAAGLIKNFACALFLQVKFKHPSLDTLKSCGIIAVGVNLEGLSVQDTELFKRFDALCDSAAQAGLRSYVHGLNTRSKTTAAVCSGFDFVCGDIVGAPVGFPGGVRAFSVFDTYSLDR